MENEDVVAFLKELRQKWEATRDEPAPRLLQGVLMLAERDGVELLERALQDDPEATAICCWSAANCLKAGKDLPEGLREFVMFTLMQRAADMNRDGRQYKNTHRNIFIVHAVKQLIQKFPPLRATRHKSKHHSPKGPSACTFVAEILSEREETVQDVWETQRRKLGVFVRR
jgi:hypothetical protein